LQNETLLSALFQCCKEQKEQNSRFTSDPEESSPFQLVQLFGQQIPPLLQLTLSPLFYTR